MKAFLITIAAYGLAITLFLLMLVAALFILVINSIQNVWVWLVLLALLLIQQYQNLG